MRERFVDRFDVILLDMGRTFMFGVDRFSDSEDYGATYHQIGGSRLSNEEVHRVTSVLLDRMLSDYRNPDYYDSSPPVLRYLRAISESRHLPEMEIGLLEQVFAMHEIGTVPDAYSETLHQLHETHRLGIVSNIWSKSDLYLKELERAEVRNLFDVIVFSSDHGHIKPSPYLFTRAIEAFDVDRPGIVFVGDSLKRDVAGAKSVGLSAIWIDTGVGGVNESVWRPDLVVRDLRDLLDA